MQRIGTKRIESIRYGTPTKRIIARSLLFSPALPVFLSRLLFFLPDVFSVLFLLFKLLLADLEVLYPRRMPLNLANMSS